MLRLKTTEMKSFKNIARYTLLQLKTNKKIREQRVESLENKTHKHNCSWFNHVSRMGSRIPEVTMFCKQRGQRKLGRPPRRLIDAIEKGLQIGLFRDCFFP